MYVFHVSHKSIHLPIDCIHFDIGKALKPSAVSPEHANLVGIPTWEFRWGGRSSTPLMKFRGARQHASGGIINCSLLVLLRYDDDDDAMTASERKRFMCCAV